MHYRHPNRTRHNMTTGRVVVNQAPDIDSFEVPTVKLGRFVDFEKSPDFSDFVDDVARDDRNQKGLTKGWFSMVEKPLFVEYADLTESLKDRVKIRARPRGYQHATNKTIDRLSSDIRVAAKNHSEFVDDVNLRREEALAVAIETDDHAEEIQEFWELFGEVSSRWGSATFALLKQAKPVKIGNETDGVLQYGYPVVQEAADQKVRDDVIEIVKGLDLGVPNQLTKGVRPVVPVLALHRELSGMHGGEPALPIPPTVELGPLEIHRF